MALSVPKMLLHLSAEMTQAKYDLSNAVISQQGKLVVDERAASNFHEGLGNGLGEGSQADRQAARENHARAVRIHE